MNVSFIYKKFLVMSSMRCKHKTCHNSVSTHHRENKQTLKGSPSTRNTPGLLRLDSTGEVTSVRNYSNCKTQCPSFKHDGLNSQNSQMCDQNCYKNFVDNLKMGSIINSASAYIGTATSYIGNWCPYKTSKGLVRSNSDNSSFEYLRSMLSGVNQSHSTGSAPDINTQTGDLKPSCKCAQRKPDKTMSWTSNILGAFQCSLISTCQVNSDKMRGVNVEKYVPPQRRYNQEKSRDISPVIDPKLTPYNAKLLEKSKRFHSCQNGRKDLSINKDFLQQDPKAKDSAHVQNNSIVENCKEQLKQCLPVKEMVSDSVVPEELSNNSTCNEEINNSQPKVEDSKCKTDWFDYECESFNSIPVSIDKVQFAAQKCPENDKKEDSKRSQQLHSWFSIENGNEVAVDTDSSLTKDATILCDKNITCSGKERIQTVEDKNGCFNNKNSHQSENDHLNSTSLRCRASQNKHEADHSAGDKKINVLYIRSLGRRGRPSAKKRRRQKAQQNDNTEQTPVTGSNTCSNSKLKPSNGVHPSSAVAFILGYGADSSKRETHSFHVSCDSEGDSDWSDSDFESDENLSSIEDESALGNLGFQCNDPLQSMQCFTLTCTVQPTEESKVSHDSSAIDNINLSWRVQVSLEPESPKKKSSSSKKVHFADEKDLATVHPMIAWSHAYQSARKGPWEQFARDRGRFLRRITDGETLLNPVLQNEHRKKIFRERFSEE